MAVNLSPDQIEEMFEKYKESGVIQDYGKNLDGPFGKIKDVKYRNKIFAGKLLLENNSVCEFDLIYDIRGPNIIRLHKICNPKIHNGITYRLMIMEKALLKNIDRLIHYIRETNLSKFVYQFPFDELLEDCLVRFFVKQIVDGLEILDRLNYNYFVRPENILITANLTLKLSNFKNLKKTKDSTDDMIIKCFTLGRTIFYIKFGEKIFEDNELNKYKYKEEYIDFLFKKISKENKYNIIDRDLIYLLIKLLKYELTFEQIYRNKWLNKNLDNIEKIVSNFEIDEEKLWIELQKQDFIIQKNKIIEYNTKIINKNLMYNNVNKGNKANLCLSGKKFKFKKKK